MKKLFKIYIILIIMLTSCEGFLDEFPPQQITSGNFYQTEEEMIMASNSVFEQLYTVWGQGALPYLYGDLYGGDSYVLFTVGTASDWEDIGNHMEVYPANGVVTGSWNNYYRSIFRVNDFLAELEEFGDNFDTPGLGTRMKAEALFVRSCFYYYLTECFGDVPLVLEVLGPEEAKGYVQEDEAVIDAQIESDLTYAVENLPPSYSSAETGRVTSWAAKGMLARVYMSNGKNTQAQVLLQDIISNGPFTLDSNGDGQINNQDYSYMFDAYTKNSPESLLELQFIHGVGGKNQTYAQQFCPRVMGWHYPGQTQTIEPWGLGAVPDELYDAFEPDDTVRRSISADMYYDDLATGDPLYCPTTTKFYHGYLETFNNGSNVPIIRYSEILLNMSEVTGDPQYLNMVRARAGLPGFGEAGYPAEFTTLDEALEHERRVEFSFEFQRGFDLKRTGRFITVKSQDLGKQLEEWRIYFPIPQAILDINKKMHQNTGYLQ